jgi:predicted esterase
MPKTPSHITPLPAELAPVKSSTQLINEHVERLRESGVLQKTIALSLGFGANYVSMLKAGEELPLPRVIAFAAAVRLSEEEREELLHARLMELHGEKGEICVETLAQWATDLVTPVGDEAKLIEMWREAISPAPHMVVGLLDDPARAARIAAVMNHVVQVELEAMAADAAIP